MSQTKTPLKLFGPTGKFVEKQLNVIKPSASEKYGLTNSQRRKQLPAYGNSPDGARRPRTFWGWLGVTRRKTPSTAPKLRQLANFAPSVVLASQRVVPEVEERFRGRVERVADGVAYLSLADARGARSFASYDAGQLRSLGILDGSAFTCRLMVRRNKAELVFQPLPSTVLSGEALARLWEPIDAVLDEYDATDDE